MKDLYLKYEALFEQRVQREKIIITCVILAVVYLIFDLFIYQSMDKLKASLKDREKQAESQISVLATEKKVLVDALSNNPNISKQREIASLETRVKELNSEIDKLSAGLIPAKKLPDVIREVLTIENDLTLLGMSVDKPRPLSFQTGEGSEKKGQTSAGVFKHAVTFRLTGAYFDVMRYLERLENSEWHFYWETLDYEVDAYPRAVAQIEAYTLSTERGFIGE